MRPRARSRLVPTLAVIYYLAMLVAVTYPGYVPFDRIRPFVLGMPLSLFWQVLWVCGAVFVLALVYAWERESVDSSRDRVERNRAPREDEG